MLRSLTFLLFHFLLALLVFGLQAGCSSFASKTQQRDPLTEMTKTKPAQSEKEAAATIAKGINLERAGDWDKARELYEEVLRAHPNEVEPLHRLAVLADKQRRHPEAQTLYMRAIQLHPRDGQLFNDLGYSFYLSGNLPKAESSAAKAVQLEPSNSRFRNNLGMIVGHQGRMQEAFEHFSQAGSEADAHYNVAFLYTCRDQPEEAKLCFHRALAADPTHDKASKALDAFSRYDQNGGIAGDEPITDGRRWIPYIEDTAGNPNYNAMTNLSITHQVDSQLPGAHNVAGNPASNESATR
jgi:Tfp pilus assembly protein PilF